MTVPSRASLRALAVPVLLATTVALTGCGSDGPSALPTHSIPSRSATPGASPSLPPPSASSTDDGADQASAAPAGNAQVVKVTKFGVSFELPKGWITLDAKKVLESGGKNPVLDQLAQRMGTTPDRLAQQFSSAVQTFSVSGGGAHHGFLDNVNSVGQDQVLNDEAIKLQLATIGAKAGQVEHATSDAGDVSRVPYHLPTKIGLTIQAVAVVVHTHDATVVVTVSSSSAATAARLADQVQASLKPLPGGGGPTA